MRRRTFLATLPIAAAASTTTGVMTASTTSAETATVPKVTHGGDRIAGAPFASRSTVWGKHGAAATAHPLATLTAIETLRAGGSAVDAAIAANAALGFLEPISCGVGGDCFVMLWDPKTRKVVGLNGSGRSPRSLSLETQRARAKNGFIAPFGAVSVSTPGAVDAWWTLHQRYGRLKWADLFTPAIGMASEGVPVAETIAYYLALSYKGFTRPDRGIEEVENFKKVWAPNGATPVEGEVFANPALAHTYRLVAAGGREGFYGGEAAATMDAYFKRIGGWLTKEDLAAHHSEWVEPRSTNYRGVDVWALPPQQPGPIHAADPQYP